MTFLRAIIPLFARAGGIPFQFEMNQYPRFISRPTGQGQAKAKCNYQLFLDVHRLLQGNFTNTKNLYTLYCRFTYLKLINPYALKKSTV
jgi:hypothetical protein